MNLRLGVAELARVPGRCRCPEVWRLPLHLSAARSELRPRSSVAPVTLGWRSHTVRKARPDDRPRAADRGGPGTAAAVHRTAPSPAGHRPQLPQPSDDLWQITLERL